MKKLLVFALVSSLVLLTACSKGNDFGKVFANTQLSYKEYGQMIELESMQEGITPTSISQFYKADGIVIIRNSFDNYGWIDVVNEEVFAPFYQSATTLYGGLLLVSKRIGTSTTQYGVVKKDGSVVIPIEYKLGEITTSAVGTYHKLLKVKNDIYKIYKDGEIKKIIDSSLVSAASIALTDVIAITDDHVVYRYNSTLFNVVDIKTGNIVYSYPAGTGGMFSIFASVIGNTKLLVQTRSGALSAVDYDYVDTSSVYKLSTSIVDFISGKEKKINFPYVISSIENRFTVSDFENFFTSDHSDYSLVKCTEIIDKAIVSSNSNLRYLAVDSNFSIKANYGNSSSVTPLSNDRYLVSDSYSNFRITDSKQNTITQIGTTYSFSTIYGDSIILRKSDTYGAINHNGDIKVPFEYSASKPFYSGISVWTKTINSIASYSRVSIDGGSSPITIDAGSSINIFNGLYTLAKVEGGVLNYYIYNYSGARLNSTGFTTASPVDDADIFVNNNNIAQLWKCGSKYYIIKP